MDKNEFGELFKGVEKEEFIKFGHFLNSPFFNVPKRIAKLYELLKYDEPLSREMISDNFYPGKKYSDTNVNVRKLISEFKNYFARFLAEREFEERKFEQKLYLLKQLRKKGQTKEYKKVLDEIKKNISEAETKDEEYYKNLVELTAEQYWFEGYHYKNYGEDLCFQISENLDLYFIAYKLFLSQRFEAREFALKANTHREPKFYEAVCKEIEENTEYYKKHPEIYCRYLMMQLKGDTYRKNLFDEYLSYLHYAEEDLKIDCYSYYESLLNHCIKMVNYGKNEFEGRIIEFAEVMENRGMLQKHGISYNDMKIIIECSIGTGKYEWGEEFVKRNIKYVEEPERDKIFNLGLAKIYFFKRDYSSSRNCLIKISYDDYIHYIDAKLIEARIEYEEKYFTGVFSITDTVKKYLRAHTEIGDIYKESYLAFINYLEHLVKLYENLQTGNACEYDIKKLREDICSYPAMLYGGEWLKDKLDEIKTPPVRGLI